MKYKAPLVGAIFFMTSFNRDRGHGPLAPPPPGSTATQITLDDLCFSCWVIFSSDFFGLWTQLKYSCKHFRFRRAHGS